MLSADLKMPSPNDLFVDDKYVYILGLAGNAWLQIYDKTSGEYVGSTLHRGRAAEEIIVAMPDMLYNEETRELQVYDNRSSKLKWYKVTSDKDSGFITYLGSKSFADRGVVRDMWKLSSDRYLVEGQLLSKNEEPKPGVKRFHLIESDTTTVSYNVAPSISKEDDIWAFVVYRRIAFSPDMSKMAASTLYGGVMEIFDINNGIKLDTIRNFYPPSVEFNDGGSLILSPGETAYGFWDMKATEKLIYTITLQSRDINEFNKISIFDWDGNEVAQYYADYTIMALYVSKDDPNKIYAIAIDQESGEYHLVTYSLDIPEYS